MVTPMTTKKLTNDTKKLTRKWRKDFKKRTFYWDSICDDQLFSAEGSSQFSKRIIENFGGLGGENIYCYKLTTHKTYVYVCISALQSASPSGSINKSVPKKMQYGWWKRWLSRRRFLCIQYIYNLAEWCHSVHFCRNVRRLKIIIFSFFFYEKKPNQSH